MRRPTDGRDRCQSIAAAVLLLAAPLMAQQNDAPELTAQASQAIDNGLATLALTELWGMTRDREDDDVIQKAIQAAVEVILRSQNASGFNYVPTGSSHNDSIACMGGGAYAAQLAGERGSEMVLSALRFLKERSPGIIDGNFGHYYYGHYYAVHAMVILATPHRYIPIYQR